MYFEFNLSLFLQRKVIDMTDWNAKHYLRFGNERTRPSIDLVSQIRVEAPRKVVDLGCGPGNSTQILRARWPSANVCGIDNSAAMIDAARASFPGGNWVLADLSELSADQSYDVVFSNAALQWSRDHRKLIPELFALVGVGGALAFQIPSSTYATVRTLIHEIADDSDWRDRMRDPKSELTIEPPSVYYDILAETATTLDIWETEYLHIMQSPDAIVDWISSTGLRPFLKVLPDNSDRERFVSRLRERVQDTYRFQVDGKVLFPFRRTFVVAHR